ncbi:MAG: AmmeMemoRadiSam system protein A [candidate division WOR-3 bacterium]
MDNNDKIYLLKLARKTILKELKGENLILAEPESEELKRKSGCFVTLKIDGDLRGCIGYIQPVMELYKAVSQMAIEAAFNDPRFYPLTLDEFERVKIEISVLTPLQKVEDLQEITVGKDGLLVKKGFRSGLLLPQVATEWGYDREQFLKQTCLKAGLYPDCYKEKDTQIYKFQAEIFSEEELNL